ncbi:hypothetical protein BZG02_10260 [Labilibaculum filiforme]|uniref:Metal-binding protein n=1 Tax=Labilibaculum filiforme TaxID=1940526 RepID=A0A2N3HYH7_9BACT|nr:DUF2284 domain-containing protein [Labilibaculum filiforme]PKQ63136.1 hypothetical protein BZG02_10260 [Labilibaculum filiforme]
MINYQTGSLLKKYHNIPITIHFKQVKLKIKELKPYLNPKKFNTYCEACPNHSQKWTCPPNCPPFDDYAKDYSHITLYLFYTSPNQFEKAKNKDKALDAYNFIKEELQNYLREVEPSTGKMIAANSCELCKTCGLVDEKECYMPNKMRYNLVAFGFNVNQLMTDLFQHELQWATKNQTPNFVSSVGAILKK